MYFGICSSIFLLRFIHLAVAALDDGDLLPRPPNCGTFPEDRNIAGPITQIDYYPWMALLFHENDESKMLFSCSGALLNDQFVLTSASCVSDKIIYSSLYKLASVRLGEWDLSTMPDCQTVGYDDEDCADEHEDFKVEKVLVHPDFRRNDHNIALIALAAAVTFSDFIAPVCLPSTKVLRNFEYEQQNYEAVGWYPGKPEWGTKKIRNIVRTAASNTECRKLFRSSRQRIELNDKQLCLLTEGYNLCPMNGGGPLTTVINGVGGAFHYLVGVFGFAPFTCDVEEKPYIFTKLESYLPWINATIEAYE